MLNNSHDYNSNLCLFSNILEESDLHIDLIVLHFYFIFTEKMYLSQIRNKQ